jgi:hypothetical protein
LDEKQQALMVKPDDGCFSLKKNEACCCRLDGRKGEAAAADGAITNFLNSRRIMYELAKKAKKEPRALPGQLYR